MLDFSTFTGDFDIPITLGASINGNGQYYRWFNGTISNVEITVADHIPKTNYTFYSYPELETVYSASSISLNGTSDFVNTGINLFSEENIDKNFEISFKVSEINGYSYNATIVGLNDMSVAGEPGVMLRTPSSGKCKFEYKGGLTIRTDTSKTLSAGTEILIQRLNGSIYTYVNTNNARVREYDYSDSNFTFDAPLVFGAMLNGSGNPTNYFKGKLTNVVVKLQP